MISKTILKFISIFLKLQVTLAFPMVKLKEMSKQELASAILNILENPGNDRQFVGYLKIGKGKNPDSFLDKDVKTKLVKRIIPHGYDAEPNKLDHRLKNIYRPFLRVYVKKPTHRNFQNPYIDGRDQSNDFYKNHKQMSKLITNKIMDLEKERKIKDIFLKRGHNSRKRYSRSSEDEDSLLSYLWTTNTPPNPKKWHPNVPFWNYWTYKKMILEDKCDGNFIEMNGHCVEIPPH